MGLLRELGSLKFLKLHNFRTKFSSALKWEIAMDYIEQLDFPIGSKTLTTDLPDCYEGDYKEILERNRTFVDKIFENIKKGNSKELKEIDFGDKDYDFAIDKDPETLKLKVGSKIRETFKKKLTQKKINSMMKRLKGRKGEVKCANEEKFKEFKIFINN